MNAVCLMSSEYQRVKIQPLKLISTGSVEMRNMHAVALPKRGTKSSNRVRYWKRRAVWWAPVSRLECCVVADAVANFVLVSWYCWLMKTNSWGMTMSNIDDHVSHRSQCGLGLSFIVSSKIMIVVIWGWCRTDCPIFPDPRSTKRSWIDTLLGVVLAAELWLCVRRTNDSGGIVWSRICFHFKSMFCSFQNSASTTNQLPQNLPAFRMLRLMITCI